MYNSGSYISLLQYSYPSKTCFILLKWVLIVLNQHYIEEVVVALVEYPEELRTCKRVENISIRQEDRESNKMPIRRIILWEFSRIPQSMRKCASHPNIDQIFPKKLQKFAREDQVFLNIAREAGWIIRYDQAHTKNTI